MPQNTVQTFELDLRSMNGAGGESGLTPTTPVYLRFDSATFPDRQRSGPPRFRPRADTCGLTGDRAFTGSNRTLVSGRQFSAPAGDGFRVRPR
jgi:hypothetical protein